MYILYMGLTLGKNIDNYTYWVDGPELPKDKNKSKNSSYKSVKGDSSLNKTKGPPPLPFKEGENVYGLKKKSKKKKKTIKKPKNRSRSKNRSRKK